MKKCCSCQIIKDETEFHFRNISEGTHQPYCKKCKSIHDKNYKNSDPEGWQKRRAINRKECRLRNKKLLLELLKTKTCVDCGESDPVVLDFDHVGKKKANIAVMMVHCSWPSILKEMSQCEIRCANCHRKKTAKQFGWFKAQ